jgi:hypothetical protein
MQHNNNEDQVGFRNGVRYVMRFLNTLPIAEEMYALFFSFHKVLQIKL